MHGNKSPTFNPTSMLPTLTALLVSLYALLLPVNLPALETDDNTTRPKSEQKSNRSLVIYFSRTGNTETMAAEIASRYQADAIRFKADEYSATFEGSVKANRDAWNEQRLSAIVPETVDMTNYQLIFLGSPIWWYRPAVPLWTFVEKNDFQGKRIVLFNTFNSRFKDKYITEFKQLVTQRGGEFVDHISVRRGRVFSQIDKDELIKQVRQLLIEREKTWN